MDYMYLCMFNRLLLFENIAEVILYMEWAPWASMLGCRNRNRNQWKDDN